MSQICIVIVVVDRIGHILNISREIDNFFPGEFKYKNIR